MRIDNLSKEQLQNIFKNLNNYIESNFEKKWIKYLDLGSHVIRLINYSDEFTPHIQKQLDYVIKDHSEKFDATIIIWKENNIEYLPAKLSNEFNLKTNLNLRIKMLARKKKFIRARIFDENYSKHNPVMNADFRKCIFDAIDKENNTYYYGVKDLQPEEFIKQGHIFVKIFNKILKSSTTNLIHGAVVGLENNGILFCARGQRGKSTLAVLSMIKDFEYVSDDYLVLEEEGNILYSHPIYSIITLSPRMYNELYDELEGSRFVSNNARKDKYVINIKNFHDRFKKKYPIKVCMFPEIVDEEKPSIVSMLYKGRAITQLIHSTINQMQDKHDIKTIQKLINMVKDFEFYQINLCKDIYANVECLREFTIKLNKKETKNDKLCIK